MMKAVFFFFIAIHGFSLFVNSQTDSCNSNTNLNDVVAFDTTSLQCVSVWTSYDFILRYKQANSSTWSFVLSTPDSNSYIAIGFSSDGRMVGSSAIVGWLSAGVGTIKRYSLTGTSPSLVLPEQGSLQLVNNSSSVVSKSSRIYMAFQLNTNQPETRLIYAIGQNGVFPQPNLQLSLHRDMISTTVNYVTGQNTANGRPYTKLRRSHGILNMLGWGILMIIGAIVARYFKQWDPIWFYLHTIIQSCGFILGISGVISGFILNNHLSVNVSSHKNLGIFILVLGCLQVMAFLARPDKASKVRNYWNWYHYIVGRILIIFAIANVFYGIHLGEKGNGWKTGYGIVLAILFITALILEVRLWMRK